jgi:putative transposase
VTVAGFITTQRAQHGIPYAASCRALSVSQAWYYKWRYGDASPRRARREQLAAAIKQSFAAHQGKWGSPRITDELRDAGWRVSEKTVAAIMREQHLVARPKRRKPATRQGKGRWRAPDLVGRDFPASKLNQKWYGDGTELQTGEGKLYLSVTWNHPACRYGRRPLRTVASPQATGDGGLAGDGCDGAAGQVACAGAA